VLQHVDDAGGAVLGRVRGGWRTRQSSPEHLGDEMFLRREVGVGGSRTDACLGGNAAHGQACEAIPIQEFHRGPTESINGVGLLGGQTAPSRLQSRIGHMSGRYYNYL
jgi:hypothetical protein